MVRSKTLIEKIDPWINRTKYGFTSFTIFVGLSFFFLFIQKEKVNTKADLSSVNGVLDSYNFTKGKKGSRLFIIRLRNDINTYQIPADFIDIFDKVGFENEVNQGDPLTIQIPKSLKYKDVVEKNIFIYSIAIKGRVYLNSDDTIEKDPKAILIIVGLGFIISGLVFYILRRNKII